MSEDDKPPKRSRGRDGHFVHNPDPDEVARITQRSNKETENLLAALEKKEKREEKREEKMKEKMEENRLRRRIRKSRERELSEMREANARALDERERADRAAEWTARRPAE